MTYCAGLLLNDGVVLASDTRTNAGLDNIATFSKMRIWERPGDRVVVLLSAGNLAVSQAVATLLDERAETEAPEGETLFTATSMFQVARLVGAVVREVREMDGEALEAMSESFSATFLLAGQIKGGQVRLFQVYAAGNFIEATEDTPFLQIGEHKYGKPILDRVANMDMAPAEAAKLLLLSFDSTLRSNLSVGMPIDLMIYRKDALKVELKRRYEADDAYFKTISESWSEALRSSFGSVPDFEI